MPTPEELTDAKELEAAATKLMDVLAPFGDRYTPRTLGAALGTCIGCLALAYGPENTPTFLGAIQGCINGIVSGEMFEPEGEA